MRLNPCKKCGNLYPQAHVVWDDGIGTYEYYIACNACGRKTRFYRGEGIAKNAWNDANPVKEPEPHPKENCLPNCEHLKSDGDGHWHRYCGKYDKDLEYHDWFFKCDECLRGEPRPTTKPPVTYIEDRIKELERRVSELERAKKENKTGGSD